MNDDSDEEITDQIHEVNKNQKSSTSEIENIKEDFWQWTSISNYIKLILQITAVFLVLTIAVVLIENEALSSCYSFLLGTVSGCVEVFLFIP
jgi:hypothetical protein